MTSLSRALDLAYAVAFLAGTYGVWSALAELVLGRDGAWPAPGALAAGLGIWALLAARRDGPS